MPNITDDRSAIIDILINSTVIALVGHSDKKHRDSYRIAEFLREETYTVYPVNPMVQEIDGRISYPDLKSVPEQIDIVLVFRQGQYLMEIVEEALNLNPWCLWTQLGVTDEKATTLADQQGLQVVVDRCIKIEYKSIMESIV
ncbi:CoA-binding protein [Anaerolineales bacterium]